ncbi:Stp1/IreP family PP2C-type Ser/Thr phosphatase [Anaerosalibacter bizertensis]|uniref:protein-serine/threonine phosphatase n=1 Tax=Anaerosalibacter bizertensis TaxID=932217 RepID=A0A9Q4AAJ6_9FIRM|nr:Stp1/IreP family PP2C-type Ser/Thr phosphatase [Anaerosalibacter bizertensis]MBV1816603.1 Stp1/IreP family PP2C-type Ser/Thr phosphatase [Bacteroidales bacterium MSK.15.36]MCB5558593.1 Stp1/IreP family PP2C-type Ser/Thr phosphatase [Anaerosalibacter bizertensis]MCG4563990.1 Stp1/IreP family PP2C-type Ser/Thr phosphatase [Anaerosalibacter bizertensis]MCG4581776.1 Stp1/IreP family PP2C-type Ser/Thr phosphatase [Anaerosalibacter bizertensis]MCG4584058.1 Stp1/IreP family PP2C-type Ser/Thr phosp
MFIGVSTDKGKVRKNNQDSYFVSEDTELPLFIVADGMGGHKAGEVASNMAVEIVKDFFIEKKEELKKNKVDILKFIRSAVEKANTIIYKKSIENDEFHGMGTTITMAYIFENKLYIGHVGDSRAYLLRNNKFIQITEDHSLVAEMVKKGSISEEEAECHPQRNIITRAIGTDEEVITDIIVEDIYKDDILLLCTDGLTNMMNDDEIKEILINKIDLQKNCNSLVKKANRLGGIDNVTVIAIKLV